MGKLINIDNGGTLTDIWVLDGVRSYHTKTLTTPYDLARCFVSGLRKVSTLIYGEEDLPRLLQSTDHIRYSTTQGTNALVEKKGPKLGLIVDRNFDLGALVDTPKKREMFDALVAERVYVVDDTLQAEAYRRQLVTAVNTLASAGAQRLVVAFAGADYARQERRFQAESISLFPRHLLGAIPILFAHSLVADPDAGLRAWTALNNAFLHPAMERFLYYAENVLRSHRTRSPLLIYRNDGYSGRVAKTIAVRTYSSGPRGGMEGIRAYARHYKFERVLSFDVGGTTTDIGLVENGEIKVKSRGEVEGIPCAFPLCDIVSVGLGGGSIFRIRAGEIVIGPDSVGGAPGPACFGMGGTEATITDALLVIGLLDPVTYFGGALKLDPERAVRAVREKIAAPLGVTVEAAAHTMWEAWGFAIAKDLKRYTDVRGDVVLAAFGGGGPLAATAVADALGVRQILIPRLSAVFSAHGIGFSDIGHAAQASLGDRPLEEVIAELIRRVRADMFSEGVAAEVCAIEAWLEKGGVRIAVEPTCATLPAEVHSDGAWVVHVRASASIAHAGVPQGSTTASAPTVAGHRTLVRDNGSRQKIPIVRVEEQLPGARASGPVVLEEAFWTALVSAQWNYEFTASGDLILHKNES